MAKKVAAAAGSGFPGGSGDGSFAGKIDAALKRGAGVATAVTRKIVFREARRRDEKMAELAKKYKPLNVRPAPCNLAAGTDQSPVASNGRATSRTGPVHQVECPAPHREENNVAPASAAVDGIPHPKRVLFDPVRLSLKWGKAARNRQTAGLVNCGNTCFMNASLQCLAHVPPFAEYVRSGDHARTCTTTEFCAFCELEKTMIEMMGKKPAIAPKSLARNLRRIAPSMRLGNHEDAHEFVISLFDCVQKSCIRGEAKDLDPKVQETTFVHQAFGGYVRNQVKCLRCQHESNTYEAALDLSLDLSREVRTVEDALRLFTKIETLDDPANLYRCDSCKKFVKARRRTSIHRPPRALQVHLKRFAFRMVALPSLGKRRRQSLTYSKMEGRIAFPEQLDLAPYLSGLPVHAKYELSGVVVHHGQADYGHYFAYVRSANGDWLRADDSRVVKVSPQRVYDEKDAYMLYYTQIPQPSRYPGTDKEDTVAASAAPTAVPSADSDLMSHTPSHAPATESAKASVQWRKKRKSPTLTESSEADFMSLTPSHAPATESAKASVQWRKKRKSPALTESSEASGSDAADRSTEAPLRRPAPVIAWNEPLQLKNLKLEDVMEREREAHERRKGTRIVERMLSARDSKAKVFAGAEVGTWSEASADSREFDSLSKGIRRKRPSQWDIDYDTPKAKKSRKAAKERYYAKFREANPFQAAYVRKK